MKPKKEPAKSKKSRRKALTRIGRNPQDVITGNLGAAAEARAKHWSTITVDVGIVGERVRKARLARGLTQFELSVRTGIGFSAISEIETGRRDVIGARVKILALALGCSADFLLGLSEKELHENG